MIGSTGRLVRLRSLLVGVLAAVAFTISQGPAPAAAAEPAATMPASVAIVRAAESHIGARYRSGATGPTRFDCSGLVYRVFTDLHLGSRIGYLRSAAGLYRYFQRRGLASRTNPHIGDLVIWGGGVHVGIYVGHGRAISALSDGVRIAPVSAVLSGFTAYLHTRLASLRVPTPGYKPPVKPPVVPPVVPPVATPEPPVVSPEPSAQAPVATPEPPVASSQPPVASADPPVVSPEPSAPASEPPAASPDPPVASPEP